MSLNMDEEQGDKNPNFSLLGEAWSCRLPPGFGPNCLIERKTIWIV